MDNPLTATNNCAALNPMLLEQLHEQAHIWLVNPESVRDPAILRQYESLLCARETAQYRRFRFAEHRHRYLVSHALVRNTLSRYLDLPPAQWHFSHNHHGRPEIANPQLPALRFNLTHTDGLAACLVTLDDDCGIDAEKLMLRHHSAGIAERMFSEVNCQELENRSGLQQLEYFFSQWTLREAYVKAIGIGISFPTRKLSFTIENEKTIRVDFLPELQDRSENWCFRLFKPTAQHIVATAIRRNAKTEKKIVMRFTEEPKD